MNIAILKKQIIQQRHELRASERQQLSKKICQKLLSHPIILRSKHIALYQPINGEVDCLHLLSHCWQQHKICYLPILDPLKNNYLHFSRYETNTTLTKNRYGILEPSIKESMFIPPWTLDLVIVPLVIFDEACHRIGMGKGYYDRTFEFMNTNQSRPKPTLLGLAYEFQKYKKINPNSWDVQLNYVMTENTIYAS